MSRGQFLLRGAVVFLLMISGAALSAQSASLNALISVSPNPVGPNDDLTYTLDVSNEGPDPSSSAQVVFTAAPTTQFRSFTTPAGWSCNPPSVGSTNTVITCTNASFGPGGATFTAVMRVAANEPNGSMLTASVAASQSNPDPNPNDNTTSATVLVQYEANLAVDKTAPATVVAGSNVSYTIAVQNLGPDPAENATLTDTLGANLTYVSITQPSGWTCGQSLGVVTCTNPSFAAGTSTFTLTATVAQLTAGSVTNDAAVTTTSVDAVSTNDQDSVSSVVTTSADLSLTKTAAATVTPGSNLAYTIVVTNSGPSDAQAVTLTDLVTLPFVSLAAPGGWSCTTPTAGATGTVTCSAATLNAAASATFTLTVSVPVATAPGNVSNTAQVSSTTADPDSADRAATATTAVVSAATLSVQKTITAGQPIAGTNVTYSVVITNSGPSTQFDNPGNEMLDQLPAGLTLVSAGATSGTAVADLVNNRVTWNGSIPNGGTVTVTIVARIDVITAANQATVNYDADGNGTNESSRTSNSAAFALSPATLSVTKRISGGAPAAGTNITYSVVITNNGPSTQLDNPGNEMDDQLPPGVTLLSATATSGTAVADLPNNRVSWNGSIPSGGTVTVTIVARIDDLTAANRATVHFDADGNGTNESSATSNAAAFAPPIPALTPLLLVALAALLALVALKRT